MPEAHARSPKRLVMLIVACALFMENLDSTILATALPAIARSLHENPLRLSLAISGYLLSLAIFIPLSGWVADRHGARRVFRAAIILFTLGSVLCGLAQTTPQLVAARVLQGIGGAGPRAVSTAMIRALSTAQFVLHAQSRVQGHIDRINGACPEAKKADAQRQPEMSALAHGGGVC